MIFKKIFKWIWREIVYLTDSFLYWLKNKIISIFKAILHLPKSLLTLFINLSAVVITVAFILFIARIVFVVPSVDAQTDEVSTVISLGVEAEPLFELSGDGISGTINAFEPIDGNVEEGVSVDFYSKEPLPCEPFWNTEEASEAEYKNFGFLGFGYISNLKNDDVLVFDNVNFGDASPKYLSVQIAKLENTGGIVSFYLDEISEKNLITLFDVTSVSMGQGETDFIGIIEKIGRGKTITGVHKVFLVVEQEGIDIGEIRFGR